MFETVWLIIIIYVALALLQGFYRMSFESEEARKERQQREWEEDQRRNMGS